MGPRKTLDRIGLVAPAINDWVGGSKYMRMLAHSLGHACQAAGVELYTFYEPESTVCHDRPLPAKGIPLSPPHYFWGERRLRHLVGLPEKSGLLSAARAHQISVLLPLRSMSFIAHDVKSIGWIPDFQHVYLPAFFAEATRQYRDHAFRLLAQRCTLVMVSSQNALEHFVAFSPAYAHKARVVPFCSLFAFEPPTGDVLATQRKFNLPAKFALVANQFWQHKNHQVVIEAVAQLRRKGIHIHVVMPGLPADYRDPTNETISCILQAIASDGLAGKVIVLGRVTEADLANLMRTAAVVIQPSRFEGWSTVVQDGKALGRPLICSDIPVHREQAPGALGFFPCDRADVLADVLAASWASLEPGPHPVREERALAAEREFARLHGQSLLRLCQEAHGS